MCSSIFARNVFPPTQRERCELLVEMFKNGDPPREIDPAWLAWALRFKVDPGNAEPRDDTEAWQHAAQAILQAVPLALRTAGLSSLDEYARRDGLIDHLVYYKRSMGVPGAKSLILHPTGRVRVGTLRLLEASVEGRIDAEAAQRAFARVTRRVGEPVRTLHALRTATLQ